MRQAPDGERPEVRTVTSAQNPALREARRLARRGPDEGGRFLVEGPQAIRESLDHLGRLLVTTASLREQGLLADAAAARGVDVVVVPPAVLADVATTVTPQEIVGVARLPDPDPTAVLAGTRLVVVLVDARDPGNVGTVVRTADAAGADAVVLAGTCVDARNPKAVRASAGSLFHLPVARIPDVNAALAAFRKAGLRLVGTDAAATTSHTDADLALPVALAFGSEAHGLRASVLGRCDEVVAVPLRGRAESLNLAATVAVVAYEAARQQTEAAMPA